MKISTKQYTLLKLAYEYGTPYKRQKAQKTVKELLWK